MSGGGAALIRAVAAAFTPFRWPIVFLAGYGAVDLVLTRAAHIAIAEVPAIADFVGIVFAIGLVWAAAARLFPPGGPGAIVLQRLGEGTGFFAVGCAGAVMTAIFVYPCNRLGFPFQDETYIAIDAALGFDWPTWFAFLSRHARLNAVLATAYYSHIIQYLATYFVTAALADRRRATEFFWAVNLSGIFCCFVSGFVPALGAKPFFGHPAEWLHDLLAVRAPGAQHFILTHLTGIVSFPSYHAVLGLVFAWAVHRIVYAADATGELRSAEIERYPVAAAPL